MMKAGARLPSPLWGGVGGGVGGGGQRRASKPLPFVGRGSRAKRAGGGEDGAKFCEGGPLTQPALRAGYSLPTSGRE